MLLRPGEGLLVLGLDGCSPGRWCLTYSQHACCEVFGGVGLDFAEGVALGR